MSHVILSAWIFKLRTGWAFFCHQAQHIKLINKPPHVQDALTHCTLVDMHLPIWTSDGVVFSGADELSISHHAPEFMALVLPKGAKQDVNSLV